MLDNNFPYNQEKPLLQIEQELLDEGFTEDELSRFYPMVINTHEGTCLCRRCNPSDYWQEVEDSLNTPVPLSIPSTSTGWNEEDDEELPF